MHSLLNYRTDRRVLISTLALLPALSGPFLTVQASAQTTPSGSPLHSWSDGPAKQAILDFRAHHHRSGELELRAAG